DPLLCCYAAPSTELYTLSLHDALPIYEGELEGAHRLAVEHGDHHHLVGVGSQLAQRGDVARVERLVRPIVGGADRILGEQLHDRSEEHTSELQSRENLVCRLLLEKKNI